MSINETMNMYFGIIEDNCCRVNVIHSLKSILKLLMLGTLCGMDELDKIIDYGKSKKEFLASEFGIEKIPSKSTLTRVVAMISPRWLGLCIVGILQSLIKTKHEQIMIDGKAIRSTDAMKSIEKMMNIVTAYTDTSMVIGQLAVADKSNALPKRNGRKNNCKQGRLCRSTKKQSRQFL